MLPLPPIPASMPESFQPNPLLRPEPILPPAPEQGETAASPDPSLAWELWVSIPSEETVGGFMDMVPDRQGQPRRRLNEAGRKFAQDLLQQLAEEAGPDSLLLDLDLSQRLEALRGREAWTERQANFLSLLRSSLERRLQAMEQEKIRQHWEATDSVTADFLQAIGRLYPNQRPGTLEQMALPFYASLRRHISAGLGQDSSLPHDEQTALGLERHLLNRLAKGIAAQEETVTGKGALQTVSRQILTEMGYPGESLGEAVAAYAQKEAPSVSRSLEMGRQNLTSEDVPAYEPPALAQTLLEELPEPAPGPEPASPQPSRWRPRLLAKRIGAAVGAVSVFFSSLGATASKEPPAPSTRYFQSAQIEHRPPALELVRDRAVNQALQPVAGLESLPRAEIIEDQTFLYPGSILSDADLLSLLTKLGEELELPATLSAERLHRLENTVRLLASTLATHPQTLFFRVEAQAGNLGLVPRTELAAEAKTSSHTGLLVCDAQIESLVFAIQAAKDGRQVTLLYPKGGLGGIANSRTGAGLRYLDVSLGSAHPAAEQELLQALGSSVENPALPLDLEERILEFLHLRYPQIRLLETENLEASRVELAPDGSVLSIITPEGERLFAKQFLDSSPEAVIARKFLPRTPDHADLSYGLVTEVAGLSQETLRKIERISQSPDQILAAFDLSREQAERIPEVRAALERIEEAGRDDTHAVSPEISYGYAHVIPAYSLYMALIAETSPAESQGELRQLNRLRDNRERINLAVRNDSGNLNGLGYRLEGKAILQGGHSLQEARFANLRELEAPHFEAFLRWLSGNQQLEVNLPQELYVRSAAVAVETLNPVLPEQIIPADRSPSLPDQVDYPDDLRGLSPSNPLSAHLQEGLRTGQVLRRQANGQQAYTQASNFFAVSKSASLPSTIGTGRIYATLRSIGTDLVEQLSAGSFPELYVESRQRHSLPEPQAPNWNGRTEAYRDRPRLTLEQGRLRYRIAGSA